MAYGQVSLTDVQQDLAFLEGNQSVPATGIDDWNRFIQRTLEEAWRAYPWDFAKTIASVSMVNGIGTLASGAQVNGIYDVRSVGSGTGDDHVYTQIPYEEQDDWDASEYRYWITGDIFQPVLNTKSTDTNLLVWHKPLPAQINASVVTRFPDSMVLAKGAQRFIRKAENPQADISQEEEIFQKALEELWSWQNRQKPRKARKFYSGGMGIGSVGGD